MSGNDESLEPPDLSYARLGIALQSLQGPHRLVARDGGGVVFPKGFYGPGMYLPEWAFIRYCAKADHQERKPETKSWWDRHMKKPSWTGLVIWIIVFRIIDSYMDRFIGVGALGAGVMLYVAFLFYRALFENFHAAPVSLAEIYPSARRLSVFGHWWDHVRAAMIAGKDTGWFGLIWQSTIFTCFGAFVFHLCLEGRLHPFVGIGLAPLFVVMAGYPLVIAASALGVYVRLRRRPTVADLVPV